MRSNKRTHKCFLLQILSHLWRHYKANKSYLLAYLHGVLFRKHCFGTRLFCFISVLMDPVESIFSSLFVLAVQIVHRNAIVCCKFTLITVIFSLALSKQSSKKYSSSGMQRWILNCLQITQAAHKNIIKRQMPFVLLNYAHWGAVIHLMHCNILRRALLESASLLSSWQLVCTCQSPAWSDSHSGSQSDVWAWFAGDFGARQVAHRVLPTNWAHHFNTWMCWRAVLPPSTVTVCSVPTNTMFKPCVSLIL